MAETTEYPTPGAAVGDVWKAINYKDTDDEAAQIAALMVEARKLSRSEYDFLYLYVPAWWARPCRIQDIDGIPVRFVQAWDPISSVLLKRIDFLARPKGSPVVL